MKNKRKRGMFLVVLLLLFIGIGFASFTAAVIVNGTAKVKGNTFDVHFENVVVNNGSVEIGEGNKAATISPTNNTMVDFNVYLDKPGDFYEFTVDVVNTGSIDAMINSINITPSADTLPNYLEYKITYNGQKPVSEKDLLKVGSSLPLTVLVKFKEDAYNIESDQLVETTDFIIDIDYGQATAEANEVSILSETITKLISASNDKTLDYSTATAEQKANMWSFTHEDGLTDYRYIGNTPNNYIRFNNEDWRIIGIFDGRIKIIKDELVEGAGMPYDFKHFAVGSSESDVGSNNWKDAQVMYYLNGKTAKDLNGYTRDGDYIKDLNGNVFYRFGYKPAEALEGATDYTGAASTWKLSSESMNKIDEVTYKLGGAISASGMQAEDFYKFERNTSNTWQGKVGLMYPSDYVYTFASGVDQNCYTEAFNCDNYNPSSSWLYKSGYTQWSISPNSNNPTDAFVIYSSGYVDGDGYNVNTANGVRPVVYLSSDVELIGTGTKTDMYTIVENQ